MNIEAYNLDSLRKLVRDLEKENKELRKLLDKAEIPYANKNTFSENIVDLEEYDLDQGGRIISQYIDKQLATKFFSMFWGREDVFAKRAKNGSYYPLCDNRWNNELCPKQRNEKKYCEDCEYKCWTRLSPEIIQKHLLGYRDDGADVVGVYPLLPDGTCRFLVFDFDNHEKDAEKNDFANENDEWHEEVDALRMICKQNGIDALVERSRSGRGAHVWIFFRKPIPAVTARNFGFLLLDKGATNINLKSFRYYDRMYPSQDVANSIGNLVALPLQGQAIQNGNSAFVDENWNAYPDQWTKLFNTKNLSLEEIEVYIQKWQTDLFERHIKTDYVNEKNRLKPWKKKTEFIASDVSGKLHIVLADGVYVDALNLNPRLQNQIRCMATFDNPVFYKNKRLGYSNYYNFSMVYMGEDVDGYIKVPRGLLEDIISECKSAGIDYDIVDGRENGRPIRVRFNGELRVQQDLAAQRILSYDNGILNAATAFGKTVVCSYLIAQRSDNLEKINYMLLGPIRYKFTALERSVEQGIDHIVIPRYTRTITTSVGKDNIAQVYKTVSNSKVRNTQIIEDIKASIENNRTPVILTRLKEHARYIYENVQNFADHVFLLYGDNSHKENDAVREQLRNVPLNESVILIATGQKIGEGFDYPRLDTLFLVSPVSYEGRLEQYVGRLNRDYDGKKDVIVYDYIDSHIKVFEKMYRNRLRTYKKIGFRIATNTIDDKQDANAIYDRSNYVPVFERDIIEADHEIIISSPTLNMDKVERFIYIVKERQEAGIKVTVITNEPENTKYDNPIFIHMLIQQMEELGITVKISSEEISCFAVIDKELIWHGGVNLLGKADVWDNLIRIKDYEVANELLEISFGS